MYIFRVDQVSISQKIQATPVYNRFVMEIEKPLEIRVCASIDEIPGQQWNRLVRGNYPFLNHGFLSAVERFDCVGEQVGWVPRHLTCQQNQTLVAAMPVYEKHNSWGEFVFDHAWADAFHRYGIKYYPKLINAVPFTPASGQRILIDGQHRDKWTQALVRAAKTLAQEYGYSGVHCLFPDACDYHLLNRLDAVSRYDCQFHWYNRGYTCFEDFLKTLKSKKRKNILHERRKIVDADVQIQWLDGHSATQTDWLEFTRLYQKIYDRKYGMPAFNLDFFTAVTEAMPDQVHLVSAKVDGQCIAAALMYSDDTTLYGRHWGCDRYVDSLHFEVCYYQGIDYCIRHGLERFDPGAQGEHKIARGFEPTRTHSLHWMSKSPFNLAIQQFVQHEQVGVQHYMDAVAAHSPFNATCKEP